VICHVIDLICLMCRVRGFGSVGGWFLPFNGVDEQACEISGLP
jgi:hypothetical protein